MQRTTITLLLCCVVLSAAGAANAQQPSGIIDGRTNPELIPDRLAWIAMFSFLGDGPKPPTRDFRVSYMEKAKLTPSQLDIVVDAASQLMIYERATQRKYKKLKAENPPGPGARDRLAPQIHAAYDDLMRQADDIIRALESDLDHAAFQNLLEFVRTKVKSEMQTGGTIN